MIMSKEQPIIDTQEAQTQDAGLDLDSDAPLVPVCPMNPEDGACEACQ